MYSDRDLYDFKRPSGRVRRSSPGGRDKPTAELRAAAREAADWLCECPEGTDQWERGQRLRAALKNC
jgi:hypothetical protein